MKRSSGGTEVALPICENGKADVSSSCAEAKDGQGNDQEQQGRQEQKEAICAPVTRRLHTHATRTAQRRTAAGRAHTRDMKHVSSLAHHGRGEPPPVAAEGAHGEPRRQRLVVRGGVRVPRPRRPELRAHGRRQQEVPHDRRGHLEAAAEGFHEHQVVEVGVDEPAGGSERRLRGLLRWIARRSTTRGAQDGSD